jgi:hypothetical protein
MGRLVGYGVSQVPTNGMLGGMAYQDPINVTVNNISVGGGTLTGTALQRLQVTGGAYVSGNLGIGTITPFAKTHIEINAAAGAGSGSAAALWLRNSNQTANNSASIFAGNNSSQASAAINFIHNDYTTNAGAISFDTRTNSSTYAERMRIDSSGAIIKNQSTKECNYSGYVINDSVITIDVTVVDDSGTGVGHKIFANHTHFNWSSYGAMLECWISSRATGIIEQLNTHNVTSGQGGAWTVTKPNTTTLRISKSAGTYPGGGFYWVRVITNN